MITIRKQTRLWKQRDGTSIRICDMHDRHLENAIRQTIREREVRRIRGEVQGRLFEPMLLDWERRGEARSHFWAYSVEVHEQGSRLEVRDLLALVHDFSASG